MSEIFSSQLTAIANVVLAVFAIVTAWFAGLAFRKQAKEVSDQAEMLELQRQQLADQRKASADQAEVLKLQAADLREAFEERKRRNAAGVTAWFGRQPGSKVPFLGAVIRNASGLPVYDVHATFHRVHEQVKGLGWEPIAEGVSTHPIRIMPPESEQFTEAPSDVQNQALKAGARPKDYDYVVSITFTDAAGNRWERDPKGALRLWG